MFYRKFYFKFAISMLIVFIGILTFLYGILLLVLLIANKTNLISFIIILPALILLIIGFILLLLFANLLKRNQQIKTNYNKMIIGHFDKVYKYDDILLLDIRRYIFYTYIIIKGNDKKIFRFFFDNKREALNFIINNDLQSLYKNYNKENFE